MKWTKSHITQTIYQMISKTSQTVNETKIILARIAFYTSLVIMGIGMAAMLILFLYWLLSNQQAFQLFVSFMGLGAVVFTLGLIHGWTEKYLEKKAVYKKP
jgi:glucose-6-phosphate isomerase